MKRGSVFDWMFVMIVIVLVSITAIVGAKLMGSVKDKLSGKEGISSKASEIITERESSFISVWDSVLVVVMFGLSLSVVVLAFLIRSHPIFYFIILFVMIIYVVLAGAMNNVYDAVASNSLLSDTASRFTMTGFVMSKLPIYAVMISVLIAVVMYAKSE